MGGFFSSVKETLLFQGSPEDTHMQKLLPRFSGTKTAGMVLGEAADGLTAAWTLPDICSHWPFISLPGRGEPGNSCSEGPLYMMAEFLRPPPVLSPTPVLDPKHHP